MKIKNTVIALVNISLVVLLSACSDGGSSSAAPDQDDKSALDPADLVLNQTVGLSANTDAKITVQLNNLPTDDAVYVSVESDDAATGQLQLSPSKTILNPNKGSASFIINADDLGLSSAPEIHISITTSGNQAMEKVQTLQWSNE